MIENDPIMMEVIPRTICQCTGLNDFYKRKIFTGDIVTFQEKKYVVKFWQGMFYASVEECNKGIYGGFPLHALCEAGNKCKIIGNIYDNPELLKKKEL